MSSITLISLGFAIFAALFAFILYFKMQNDIADVKQQLAAIKNMQNRSVSPTLKVLTQSRTTETTNYSLIYNVEQQAIAWMLWLWQKTTGWLFSGNYIAKLGIFIFLIGIALLLKFAAEYAFLRVEWRLCLAAVAGLGLLIIGWVIRKRRPKFTSLLIGSGICVLYMTIYCAFVMYQLIPASLAITSMVLISLACGGIAIQLNTQYLALIAIIAGFFAPILTSNGGGSYLFLLIYFLVLNVGVAQIAYYRAWRSLNFTSFVLTFTLSGFLGFSQYSIDTYFATQGCLAAYIILHTLMLLFFTQQQKDPERFDLVLALGIPILGFACQALIARKFAYGMAFSTLGFAAYYACLAWYLITYKRKFPTLLKELMLAFATLFITLTPLFVLQGEVMGAVWALEGSLIIWLGARRQQWLVSLFGTMLLLIANYFVVPTYQMSITFIFVIANYLGAYFLTSMIQYRQQLWRLLTYLVFIVAIYWNHTLLLQITGFYFGAISIQLHSAIQNTFNYSGFNSSEHFLHISIPCVYFLALAGNYMVFWMCYEKWRWNYLYGLVVSSVVTYPVFLLIIILLKITDNIEAFIFVPLLTFSLAFALQNYWLKRMEEYPKKYTKLIHIPVALTIILFATWWTKLFMLDFLGMPPRLESLIYGLMPALMLLLLNTYKMNKLWMVKLYPKQYYGAVSFILVLYLLFWLFFQNFYISKVHFLPFYIPILNLKDMTSFIIILSIMLWLVSKRNLAVIEWGQSTFYLLMSLLGCFTFMWINTVLLRALSIYFDLNPHHLFEIQAVQMSLSILWAVTALVIIITAHLRHWRKLWIAGSILVALIIIKLVLVDFIENNTLERIVSFVSVGLLFLITGYFAPIPPKKDQRDEYTKENTVF